MSPPALRPFLLGARTDAWSTGAQGNYFEDIDRTVKQLLDEAELVRLRRRALGELQQALAAAGELVRPHPLFTTHPSL